MIRIQLALHHGDTKIAQLKVEEWLAAVPPPFLHESTFVDISGLTNGESNGVKQRDYYGKVLESYCLALLPQNEEWDFANTFIDTNEYLPEARKKVSIFSEGNLTLDISHQIGGPKSPSGKGKGETDHPSSTTNISEVHQVST